MLGIEVAIQPPHIPEIREPHELPQPYVERLAREKAASVSGDLVLAADTTVVVEGEVLEKPADPDDALRMLRRLQAARTKSSPPSRSRHPEARSRQPTSRRSRSAPRTMPFSRPTWPPANRWIRRGAYGIQGYGAALVEGIQGDFFSVMGLPVRLVLQLLEQAGHPYRFGPE
jgi:septum formation protein